MQRRQARSPWEEAYRTQGRLWRGVRLDDLTHRVMAARPALRNAAWLDAGCGDGKGLVPLSAALAPEAPAPIGADAARWALVRTREAFHAAGRRRPPFVRADARSWPFADAVFGALRAVYLFGHLPGSDRGRAFDEAFRVLAPAGVLLVSEFGAGDFRAGTGTETEPGTFRRGVGIETHYFSSPELSQLAAAAGFVVEHAEPVRYAVGYGGVERPRERIDLVARRPA